MSLHQSLRSHLFDQDHREMSSASQCSKFDGNEDPQGDGLNKQPQNPSTDEEKTSTASVAAGNEAQEEANDCSGDEEFTRGGDGRATSADAGQDEGSLTQRPPEEIRPRLETRMASLSTSIMPRSSFSAATEPSKDLLRPTELAEYERKLSVCGDDRRKDDACDLGKYHEIVEEDRAAGMLKPGRRPSWNSQTIMEDALERTLQEKALFRASKEPSFSAMTWTGNSRISDESVDPLDETACRAFVDAPSWCRWPSHTRAIRSGPAVDEDVIVRDFAMPVAYQDRSKVKKPVSTVKRYYTDLLTTSDFHGKGHRTSISEAGMLKNPELELIPHVLPVLPEPSQNPDWVQSDGAGDIQHLSAMYSELVMNPYHKRGLSEKSFLRESSHDLLRLVEAEKERCEQDILGSTQ